MAESCHLASSSWKRANPHRWLFSVRAMLAGVLFIWLGAANHSQGAAAPTVAAANFQISAFDIQSKWHLPAKITTPLFSKYTGTNVSVEQVVQAASALAVEYARSGYTNVNIVAAPKRIKNGVLTFDVFPGAVAQIVVAGRQYLPPENGLQPINYPAASAMKSTNVNSQPVASPRFTVHRYQVQGNTLLGPQLMSMILTNITDAFGTNVGYEQIVEVSSRLQAAYRDRGYATVVVQVPPQRLTDATVKLNVVEGRLHSVVVKGNHYFSSNNVMTAVPGLAPGMILNAETFQAEVNRANANQDRQISGMIEPGPDPGTSDLTLQVKDRLPLHAKTELNNNSSPGTPELRVNSSLVYNNLWQLNQALGLQYSFSPEQYKEGALWKFFDRPTVANYSAFYRIPLGNPEVIDDQIAAESGSFGYDEATHKFKLPPASGQPDLTFFASRSTIDNGVTTSSQNLYTAVTTNFDGSLSTNSTLGLDKNHQDITINNDLGFRFSYPFLATASGVRMAVSGGLDYKTYENISTETNIYVLNTTIIDTLSGSSKTNNSQSADFATLPKTHNKLDYLPLALRYDVSWRDFLGVAAFGVGLSVDLWDSALSEQTAYGTSMAVSTNKHTGVVSTNMVSTTSVGRLRGNKGLQAVSGSKHSTEHWVAVTPNFSHTFQVVTNWVTTFRADGQWSSQPLISNEQFGLGGVNNVRGYQEGEVFGDSGWHIGIEQQTPPHIVGMIAGRIPLIIRGTAYMDYGQVYLLDPQGRQQMVALWGTGAGVVASIGSWWQARLLFSVPLLSTSLTTAYHPYFNFALTGQF
ncbi:MAG TPA: POTRA domain-containing protein [Verrucomicrobiae bacterium]